MNIGEVSERSGLPPKTIRYYEDINLVRPLRSDNGYRSFRESDIHKLAFLGRARALGFVSTPTRPAAASRTRLLKAASGLSFRRSLRRRRRRRRRRRSRRFRRASCPSRCRRA